MSALTVQSDGSYDARNPRNIRHPFAWFAFVRLFREQAEARTAAYRQRA